MVRFRLTAGRFGVLSFAAAALFATAALASAVEGFPFDQELLLDASPMGRGKRMPMLTIAPNGNATIDLWCKSVAGRVEINDEGIVIQAEPLPEVLPAMQSRDQCTPQRIQADGDLLEAITQSTAWRKEGSGLVLLGPKTLKFRLSDH